MTAPRAAGEITFYEELGVDPGASPEAIRDAFRSLVRILHPDQQTDPQLKEIAETQMRKLNRIYAVLSDLERRRRYDEVLLDNYGPRVIVGSYWPTQKRTVGRLAWGACILGSAALLIWLAVDGTPETASRARNQTSDSTFTVASPERPGNPAEPSSQVSHLQSDLRIAILERDAAVTELNRLKRNSSIADSSNSAPHEVAELRPPPPTRPSALTMTELPLAPAATVNSPSPSRVEHGPNRQFAGFWFYAKPPDGQHNKNRAIYPPEYIEVTITEENGLLHGKYRARFRIIDQAISPEVNFSFTGTENGSQTGLPWTGPGGAKGDLTMKLTSENTLKLDWMATELGTTQGLNSGTAVLSRRLE